MKKQCKECKFFKPEAEKPTIICEEKMGECYFNPPIAFPFQTQDKFSRQPVMALMNFRPKINEETEQCGRFSPKLAIST